MIANRLKTFLLLVGLSALLIYAGAALGGRSGLMIAFVFAIVMNVGSYWFSDKIVLAMYRARPVTPEQAPRLYALCEKLAKNAKIPMPRIYIIPERTPNAFATGRNPQHGVVALTEGIMEMLNERELAGVIAHEMGHIKNRDILVQTIAAVVAASLQFLAQFALFFSGGRRDDRDAPNPVVAILIMILAPIAAMIIQAMISRTREYMADATGAAIAQDTQGLQNALLKIDSYARGIPMHHAREATAHMFIINPLAGGGVTRLFSTHPATEERVKALQALDLRTVEI